MFVENGWQAVRSRAQGKQGIRQGGIKEGKRREETYAWEYNHHAILDQKFILLGFLAEEDDLIKVFISATEKYL